MTGPEILTKIRKAGFTLTLDDNDNPKIKPLDRLSANQRELLKTHKDVIRLALLEEKPKPSLLTPFDEPSWDALSAWWLDWTPPAEPYQLDSAVLVSEPARNYEFHADLVRLGVAGQVQLALADWIKRHWRKFGGTLQESRP